MFIQYTKYSIQDTTDTQKEYILVPAISKITWACKLLH